MTALPDCPECNEPIEGRGHDLYDELICDDCWNQVCEQEGWCPGCGTLLQSRRWALCRDCGREAS